MQKILPVALLTALVLPVAAAQEGQNPYEPSLESMMEEVRDVGDMVVTVHSKHIQFAWSGIVIGPNMSAWIRHHFDQTWGDGNGTVEIEEMEAGEEVLKVFLKAHVDSLITDERASGYFLIDSNNPQSVQITQLVSDGVVGPVNSSQEITLSFTAAFVFATANKDVHSVTLDMGKYYFRPVNETFASDIAGDFTLTIRPADGWEIDPESIQPGCVADAFDNATGSIRMDASDVNCFTGRSGLLIGMSILGDEGGALGVPGPGLPLMVFGLLGLVAVLRRKA